MWDILLLDFFDVVQSAAGLFSLWTNELHSRKIEDWPTDYRRPVRKSTSLHCPKSTPTAKFLGTAEAYFCLPHQLKFSDFFDLCLHWVSIVRDLAHLCANGFKEKIPSVIKPPLNKS